MFVYVLNRLGEPLMPCKQAVARLLLKDGKAKVKNRMPFTIKLVEDSTEFKQPIVAGMDTGSQFVGCAAIANGNVLYQSEIKLRSDVSKKMQQRAMYRRTRRGRKCRYRPARWLNRASMRAAGRLAPSIRSKVESHLREKKQVEKILPITRWKVETASFDIHKITNPDVTKSGYQQGDQKGFYNVKAFVLHRDNYTCQSGRKVKHSEKLHVHHVVFRSQGGSNAPSNLKVLCEICHSDLHAGKFVLKEKKSKTKHATEIGIIKAQLIRLWDFEETFGYETKFKREVILALSKTHYHDAVAICCEDGEVVQTASQVFHKRHVASGDYQQTKGIRSEKKIPVGKLFGLRKYDFIRTPKGTGFVKGKRSSGYFALETILGEKIHASANIKKNTVRLTARTTTLTQQLESASNSSRH
jgi:5-methylcytosine-specific restriction endonuclease McrA